MANTNSVQHAQLAPQGGKLCVMYGTVEIASAQSTADTVTFFTVPAGTTIHGGKLRGDDIDTGTEAYECDIGDASSSTRFLNSGVLTGDAVTGTKPEAGISIDLFGTLKDGPYTYTSDTNIIGTVVAPNSGGTGTLTLTMECTYQDARVTPPSKPI